MSKARLTLAAPAESTPGTADALRRAARRVRKGDVQGYLDEILAAHALALAEAGTPVLSEPAMLTIAAMRTGQRPIPREAPKALRDMSNILDADQTEEDDWLKGPPSS